MKRLLSVILTVSLLASLAATVSAAEGEIHYPLSFHLSGETVWLDTLKKDGIWYAQADRLASLSGGKVDDMSDRVTIVRGELSVPLYTAESTVQYEGMTYVPLAESSAAVGLEFFMHAGKLTAQQRKTPAELERLTQLIMWDDDNDLSTHTPPIIWDFYLTTSRVWSILPIVGSSDIVLEVTGLKEKERYRDAYGELLIYQDPAYNCLADIAYDLDKAKDWTDIVTLTAELLEDEDNDEARQWLEKEGLTQEIVSSLFIEETPSIPGDSLLDKLGGFGKAVDVMKIPYALNTLAYLGTVWDAEASTITALAASGEASENKAAQEAAKELREAYIGKSSNAATAEVLARTGAGMGMNIVYGLASDFVWQKLSEGVYLPGELFGHVYDKVFGISNKSEGTIGYTIFSNIQTDMLRYYNAQMQGQDENRSYNMRAATIVYLNAVVAGCNALNEGNQSLSKIMDNASLPQAMEKAKSSYVDKLQSILAFQEADCRQDYDNQTVLDWLEENYQKPVEFPHMNAANIAVKTKEIQHPVEDSNQFYTLHYDLPMATGDEPQVKMLNDIFTRDMDNFSHATDRHERLACYIDDEEWIGNTWFFKGTVTAEVTQNAGSVLSVCYRSNYIYDHHCSYGMTFDLNTGKQLSISQCFPQDKGKIETIVKDKLKNIVKNSDIAKPEILECLDSFDLDALQYYVKDGELIVISPEVHFGDGSVTTEDAPTGIMLDGSVKKGPKYMTDYIGMTVGEVVNYWGRDYSVTEDWFLGDLYGFYYEDERVNAIFYFSDPHLTGDVKNNAVIEAMEVWGKNTRITPKLSVGIPYEDLIERYDGEFSDGGGNFWDYCYEFTAEDSTSVIFGWMDGYGMGDNSAFISRFT